ncbi:hypothetical protein RhiJN_01725 [Ceratobasidium sp. AG-Ba]|nr:hypothetical protein RhiJN_01725 [Ceratobasidium sp. AG-Ba]QRW02652.1 hypothetical protein RhiLY_01651 [Ceratobasidium sp. AG-Ba]
MSSQLVLRPHKSQVLKTVSDLFPPWQGVADLASKIVDLVKGFHSAKMYWEELGTYVEGVTTNVAITLAQANLSQASVKAKLEILIQEIERERALPRYKRAFRYLHDLERIADMKQRLNDTIKIFQLGAIASTYVAADQALSVVTRNEDNLTEITQRSTFIAANLRRAADASWNPDRVCYPGTRARLVQQIIQWVDDPRGTKAALTNEEPLAHLPRGAQILLLTGVAGAGKSTVAHTIAQHYFEKGQLGSSFFFDREDHDRKKPIMLLNTIAADLANLDPLIAKQMCEALKREWGLPSAPVSRQFKDLVLKSFSNYSTRSPVILVIDGLNEGWDDGFIRALRDGAAELPDNFRIFLTSRMQPELDNFARKDRVCWLELDIGSQDNMDDVARFIPHALQQLAEDKNLGERWPGDDLQTRFTAKAGGLFLWVTIVCDYLRTRSEPTLELEKLLSNNGLTASTAEARMNHLYKIILSSFDHNDESFTASYNQLMGAVLATKVPLTVLGMEALLQHKPLASDFVFQKLSPLLTGLRKADHGSVPVRILHESLRDFLGSKATSLSHSLDEKEHSRQLAFCCLNLLSRDLVRGLAGTGYLSDGPKNGHGIPLVSREEIPEGLYYACQFWAYHALDVSPSSMISFDLYVQDAISQVAAVVASSKTAQAKAGVKIGQLLRMLESIAKEIEDERFLPRINRAARFMRDPQRIARMKERSDDVIRSFQLSVASSNLIMSNQTYNMAVWNRAMCEIAQRSTFISANLRRRDNSSWNPKLVCRPDTHFKLLEQVFAWVNDPQDTRNLLNRCNETSPDGAQILLLTGVAGAGKNTVSHSVARHYHGTGQSISSFFFNRRHAGDSNKSSVFLDKIAADLANMDSLIAQRMCEVLSQDWRLPSRSIPEQFSKLVIEPLYDYHSSEPAILVIDGLDEEYDQALVDELCGGAARLPNNFRIFITSRMNLKLDELSREKRVCWLELDIVSKENKDDIASKFIPQSLAQLAKAKDLGQDWPGQEIQDRFTLKAGGLFLWVIVVCKYLSGRQD